MDERELIARIKTEGLHIKLEREVTSTNDILKEAAARGAKQGEVLIALSQTKGRGRLGKSFFSPLGTGVYISLLLRPDLLAAPLLTTAAAVAVCRGIGDVLGLSAGIKWVNDIYLNGGKVCGILAESGGFGDGRYAVLGLGINLLTPPGGFPEDIKEIAAPLFTAPPRGLETEELLAKIIDRFFEIYEKLPDRDFMREYRERSILTGRGVNFALGDERLFGTVLGITDDGKLRLRLGNGEEREFSSGEIEIDKDFLRELRWNRNQTMTG